MLLSITIGLQTYFLYQYRYRFICQFHKTKLVPVYIYGTQECCFKHHGEKQNGIDDEISGIKTVDLVKRLFDMMEVFAE